MKFHRIIMNQALNIEDYRTWAEARLAEAKSQGVDKTQALRGWVIAYAESLAQMRSDEVAPKIA
ncbi:hypothetical protein [Sphingobium sp. D43FB]|uniref:hypothetical protein n=1 Tax=Sphingobium sp. D43FB TaxID=2017595 RepID=UPI00114459E7|nr:hypothetical protein [Sphingobium sp. D43FB]